MISSFKKFTLRDSKENKETKKTKETKETKKTKETKETKEKPNITIYNFLVELNNKK